MMMSMIGVRIESDNIIRKQERRGERPGLSCVGTHVSTTVRLNCLSHIAA